MFIKGIELLKVAAQKCLKTSAAFELFMGIKNLIRGEFDGQKYALNWTLSYTGDYIWHISSLLFFWGIKWAPMEALMTTWMWNPHLKISFFEVAWQMRKQCWEEENEKGEEAKEEVIFAFCMIISASRNKF